MPYKSTFILSINRKGLLKSSIYLLLFSFFILYVTYFHQYVEFVFAATATSVDMWLNNTLNMNISLNYPSDSNVTAKTTPAGIRVTLQRNGTIVTNGVDKISDIASLPIGVYNYTANFSGNLTHSAFTRTQWLTLKQSVASTDQITFYKGWNLISFRTKTIIAIPTDNCNIGAKFFYYFNSQTKQWEQYRFYQLIGGRGYLVYSEMSSPCLATFSGTGEVGTVELPSLKAGFNQVGTKSSTPYLFSSTVGSCSVTAGPFYWDSRSELQGGQRWVTVQPTDNFEANKGYWVYVSSDCSFV